MTHFLLDQPSFITLYLLYNINMILLYNIKYSLELCIGYFDCLFEKVRF